MLCENTEFQVLMAKVSMRDQAAAKILVDRFGPELVRAARRRIGKHLRSKFDSADFVQDVWASFFADPPAPGELKDQEHFVARLTLIARNKVVEAARQRPEAKIDNACREQSLHRSAAAEAGALMADQPTPSQEFSQTEEWSRVLAEQPPAFRRILILLRSGQRIEQVAADLGIHERTVRRVIQKILPRLRS